MIRSFRLTLVSASLAAALAACGTTPSRPIADPLAGGSGKADGGKPIEVQSWGDATNVTPASLETVDANYDADNCELWLNGFGEGSFENGGASETWLEAYLSTPPQDGTVQTAGMFVVTADDVASNYVMLGTTIATDYWRTGFTTSRTLPESFTRDAEAVAFFVDVQRPDGQLVRLWQSDHGANYAVADAFALPPSGEKPLGGGEVDYANDGASIFDQKHACE